MIEPTRGLSAIAASLLVVLACEGAPLPTDLPARQPQAIVVADPPELGIGQRTIVQTTVTTLPEHRLVARPPSEPVEGFDVVGVSMLPVDERPDRWVHVARFELRARSIGSHSWPAGAWRLEGPDGEPSEVRYAAVPIEVVSILPEFPGRTVPFGPRAAAAAPTVPIVPIAAAAITCLLAAVAWLFAAARPRAVRSAEADTVPQCEATPAWTAAQRELEEARATLASDALAAAGVTAAALRRYMDRRFAASTAARTTDELERTAPPFAATSRWPDFVSLLRDLDALRFPRPESGADERVAALVSRVEAFVESSLPPEPLR